MRYGGRLAQVERTPGSSARLLGNQRGAAAATAALSLFGLVMLGGLAIDYSRMMSLDSELQNAADQAALAAATQLDGKTNACNRAIAAARSMITNQTHFANDGNASGLNVGIATTSGCAATAGRSIKFYSSYTNDTTNTAATSDATAKFVSVAVDARVAVYALTPFMGLFNSGNLSGLAVAGLGTAICKVPPVMICNPDEVNANSTFNASGRIGYGLKLVSVGNGGGSWAPGNFGYLNTGGGSNGAPGLREALGWDTPPGDCIGQTGVNTKPGASVSVTDALNTRFDIYDSNQSCPTGGACPSSINSVKDLVRPGNANGNNACAIHNQGWQEVDAAGQYLPTSATAALPTTTTPLAMGHPRDMCHAVTSGTTGYCSTPIGNGLWDRDAYFRVNYGWTQAQWQANTGLGTAPTRYAVYQWEIANRGTTVGGRTVLASRVASGNGANALTSSGAPICSAIQGYGSGTVPGTSTVDRRRISAAVVNCTANSVNGSSTNVPVDKWIDLFLVEPSIARARTGAGDIYTEIIGETASGAAGATAGQVVRRDKPYLIE